MGSHAEGEAGAGEGHSIQFARAGVTALASADTRLLDLAEENDVDIGYACRSGSCGQCKVRLLKGEVDMENDEGLAPAEKKEGYILSCVATAKGPCVLDA